MKLTGEEWRGEKRIKLGSRSADKINVYKQKFSFKLLSNFNYKLLIDQKKKGGKYKLL